MSASSAVLLAFCAGATAAPTSGRRCRSRRPASRRLLPPSTAKWTRCATSASSSASGQEAFQRDLAALSHDIRTPLAGAQGYLQLHERSADPAERERCLREASSRLSAMRELTDRLFDYAKAADADSPFACEPVEVLPILAEVLAGAYPQFLRARLGARHRL